MFENENEKDFEPQADLSGLDVVVADKNEDDIDDAWEDDEDSAQQADDDDASQQADPIDDLDWDEIDADVPAAPDIDWDDDLDLAPSASVSGMVPAVNAAAAGNKVAKKGGGKHAAKPKSNREVKKEEKQRKIEEMPEHQRRSLRTRKVLIAVLVLILALAAAAGYFVYQMYLTSQQELGQQVSQADDVDAVTAEGQDAGDSGHVTQKTQVPKLTGLFGMTQDDAVEAIGHGATVTTTQDVNEEGSSIKKRVSVELSEEPGDSKSGTPTVYLGLDEDDKVIMAGYSAATASLGYGTLSLQDIVANEHVIERTLVDAGVVVEDGAAQLPEDASEYQTYDTDGVTLVRENASFEGTADDADGNSYKWTGVLAYDYTAANASGNLADTVRQVYIYLERE